MVLRPLSNAHAVHVPFTSILSDMHVRGDRLECFAKRLLVNALFNRVITWTGIVQKGAALDLVFPLNLSGNCHVLLCLHPLCSGEATRSRRRR